MPIRGAKDPMPSKGKPGKGVYGGKNPTPATVEGKRADLLGYARSNSNVNPVARDNMCKKG